MLDLHLLRTFLAVAAGLSFRQAAARLHYAPSTVTAQIKALEEQAGQPLFVRSGRTVLLTEHGARLVPQARRLLDVEREARAALTGGEGEPGELAVRVSESLGIRLMPRVLPMLRVRFPHVRVSLSTRSLHGLARDVLHGVTELAVILSEPFAAEGVEVEALRRVPLVVIAAPGTAPGGGGKVCARDLDGVPLVLTPHVWSARGLLDRSLARAHASTPGVVECASVEMVKRCVAAGLGISLVPGFTVEREAARGELEVLGWAGEELSVPVLLVKAGGRRLSGAAAAFEEAVRRCVGDDPGLGGVVPAAGPPCGGPAPG
ncbi:LysR family transcriptional regulator [Fundidesulfovibrio soli]|uniref:LysR family transcriptional regulator n=1 Tax=Fundidesulfovibrio soli TaxID=2922716 RepID=UPI001FAEBB0E|nr:LysR family transcriptional regulator [Fundidesulfovibrio soli]